MSYEFEGFAPQGWQCPICHAVWSPTTPMCYNCTGKEKTYTYSSGTYKVDDINKYIENINTNKYSNVTITNNPSTKTIHNGETDYTTYLNHNVVDSVHAEINSGCGRGVKWE